MRIPRFEPEALLEPLSKREANPAESRIELAAWSMEPEHLHHRPQALETHDSRLVH